jgi:hypothetical protein
MTPALMVEINAGVDFDPLRLTRPACFLMLCIEQE